MDLEKVLSNLKAVDCPVDLLQERIKDACRVPGLEENPVVVMDRNENMDKENLKAYDIHIINVDSPKVIALIREGEDGYVATVMDAFILY
jgi:hypothetical protein